MESCTTIAVKQLGSPVEAKKHDIQSQWVRFSMEIWFGLVKQLNKKEICILMWPTHDPDFKPGMYDGGFTQWARNGLSTLCQFVENQEFIDFKSSSDKFSLARQDLYRYLQLQHNFDTNIKGLIQKNISGITKMFIKAYNTKLSRKIIGELYRHIVELRGHSTNYIKVKWEKELGIVITSEDWTNIINTQITTTASQTWRDYSWKNCIRFFITPKQKSKQTGQQPTCWRGCGYSVADHTHIF